ncbi:hypothetical protein ISN45_At04g023590 [Arabidopsis thaliana x Arabidopsis arenosa]|nr:hypothetical protein ISN45_At04g023590 [Arabidopsis thaliana x Arabidopsis arenosa]
MRRMCVVQENGHHGQLKPCGILRPQTLKKMPKLGEREKRLAPTDLQKQVTASRSDTLRTMEQHGSALPVVRRPSLIARIPAHIFSSVSFLEHMPTRGGDSGGVIAGGGGGVVCGGGGCKVCGGSGGGEIVGDGPGQLKPCGILRPQTLKKMPKLGEREKRGAPTDLQKQVTASRSDTFRMMEQHGSALPVVRRPSLIARIPAHIFSSVSFLEHIPTRGGDSGGVIAGGGGGVVCGGDNGGGKGFGGSAGGVVASGGVGVIAGGGGDSGGVIAGGGGGVIAGGGGGVVCGGDNGGGKGFGGSAGGVVATGGGDVLCGGGGGWSLAGGAG